MPYLSPKSLFLNITNPRRARSSFIRVRLSLDLRPPLKTHCLNLTFDDIGNIHEAGGSVAANIPFNTVCFIRKGNTDEFEVRLKVGHAVTGPHPEAVNINETSMKMEAPGRIQSRP